jgi:hypothetical protein
MSAIVAGDEAWAEEADADEAGAASGSGIPEYAGAATGLGMPVYVGAATGLGMPVYAGAAIWSGMPVYAGAAIWSGMPLYTGEPGGLEKNVGAGISATVAGEEDGIELPYAPVNAVEVAPETLPRGSAIAPPLVLKSKCSPQEPQNFADSGISAPQVLQ